MWILIQFIEIDLLHFLNYKIKSMQNIFEKLINW